LLWKLANALRSTGCSRRPRRRRDRDIRILTGRLARRQEARQEAGRPSDLRKTIRSFAQGTLICTVTWFPVAEQPPAPRFRSAVVTQAQESWPAHSVGISVQE
jgi:hypothetical protein